MYIIKKWKVLECNLLKKNHKKKKIKFSLIWLKRFGECKSYAISLSIEIKKVKIMRNS